MCILVCGTVYEHVCVCVQAHVCAFLFVYQTVQHREEMLVMVWLTMLLISLCLHCLDTITTHHTFNHLYNRHVRVPGSYCIWLWLKGLTIINVDCSPPHNTNQLIHHCQLIVVGLVVVQGLYLPVVI